MPGAFASLDTGFPNLSGNGSAEDKLRAVQDYLYQLLEQLRYSMNNLGAENFNENSLNDMANTITKPIKAEIQDVAAGLTTLIEVTAGQVLVQVTSDLAPEWAKNTAYQKDDVVKVTPAAGTDDAVAYYKAKTAHTSSDATKPGSGTSWGTYWAEDTLTGISQSIIRQTADSITSTVASAQSKYDLSALPAGVSISAYGYGVPTVQAASGTVYLDQATGYYYTSNGSTWTQSANPLPMITTEMQSQITQLPGEIMLDVRGDYADEWRVWADAGQTTRMRYYPNDVVKVSSASAVAFYKCNTEHLSYSTTKPPSANWDAVAAPSVQSMIDANLNGITLAYNNTGVTGDNSSYIKLHKDGIDMGGGTIQMTNVKADSLTANAVNAIRLSADQITAGTLDASQVTVTNLNADNITSGTLDAANVELLDKFTVKAKSSGGTTANAGYIGGNWYSATNQGVILSSMDGKRQVEIDKDAVWLEARTDNNNYAQLEITPTGITARRRVNGGAVETVDLFNL